MVVKESPRHGIGKGRDAQGGRDRCSSHVLVLWGVWINACLCEPFPTLLHLLCFLQTCFIAKGLYLTCRLLLYFCSLTLYTNLPFLHFMGFIYFSCCALSPCMILPGISLLLTDWLAVPSLSPYPECSYHVSLSWCTGILILAGPTQDLSLFHKLKCSY